MSYVVPIGDELSSHEDSELFHTQMIEDYVAINFQQLHRRFRIANLKPIDKVSK